MKRHQRIPSGVLTKEVHFACETKVWNEIVVRLREQVPNEACVFVLTRPSRGIARKTAILREIIWPNPGEVKATPYNLEMSAEYISRAMDAAVDAGELVGITLIHTHPETELGKGIGRFSYRDNWYENRLFPTITLGRAKAISGSIVLGSGPHALDARIWWNDGKRLRTQPAQVVRIVGPEVSFIETPYSQWKDHPDPEMMDRSTRLWGVEGRRKLQNIRAGIVGVGGTGSITLLSLATMGVGKIRAWDKDIVKKQNLHRTLGTRKNMIGEKKIRALAPIVRGLATADPFKFEPTFDWGTTAQGLIALKDCDIVFCCVDKFAPRVPLNDLAYAHLIPVIDMASWIHPSNGRTDAIMTHAHVWSPGIPCAWCRQTLTSFRLMQEAQGNQRGIENRAPYGLTLEQTDGDEPSVLPLNLTGVGLALLEFMQVVLRVSQRTPRDLKLFLPEWELDESDLDSLHDCTTENNVGSGDAVRITPVPS